MESGVAGWMVGPEIHGFQTMEDLDMVNVLEEAKTRWLRPNEIHAILCNHHYFKVQVKPLNFPPSGTVELFDRKKLRNFRKDGHNWKKKKDGKTVKEAHEHLKVGTDERIHVYYAHGEDNPTFVRRCYWLLDKSLEHIVLVHYRDTQEVSSSTSGYSNSGSAVSNPSPSPSRIISEETDSAVDRASYSRQMTYSDPNETVLKLHELNTLEWDELLVSDNSNKPATLHDANNSVGQSYQYEVIGYNIATDSLSTNVSPVGNYLENLTWKSSRDTSANVTIPGNVFLPDVGNQLISASQHKIPSPVTVMADDELEYLMKGSLQNQDSFERWMNTDAEYPVSLDSISTVNQSTVAQTTDQHRQIFYISDISPSWALSNEEAKVLVVVQPEDGLSELVTLNMMFMCGDDLVPAQHIRSGVFRVVIPPKPPGNVNIFLTFDGQKPISQVTTFEFRAPQIKPSFIYSEDESSWETFNIQMRLAHLLFSTSNRNTILSNMVSQENLKEAKKFIQKISNNNVEDRWTYLTKSVKANEISFGKAKSCLFELTLQNRMYEWLLERVVEGCMVSERDEKGLGIIHLCAILDYEWAVYPFSWSGLSLDYRDRSGWTALHWAAYYGREKMVAKLLSAGAKANLVTDPTPENPGGSTAADLASTSGHDGLSAYLAEKALVQHFEAMTLAGNMSGSLQPPETAESAAAAITENLSEEELHLKDTLAAYRNAADAAARIQAAFREHSFKVQTKEVESSNPEREARNIVAAMKIQHAFRNYETRKQLAAAARIQYRFRTWKMRKHFVKMRQHTIKIQAIFRGFQVRKQYRKIMWSVGVLEKVVLRWRLKRKGLRGLQVKNPEEEEEVKEEDENDVEEDFFKISRKQADERIERSVVRVQALFRSKRAQEEYQRMKLACSNATMEYEELQNPNGMKEG